MIGTSSWQDFKDYWIEKIDEWNQTYSDDPTTVEV